jgi:hypothetical protein
MLFFCVVDDEHIHRSVTMHTNARLVVVADAEPGLSPFIPLAKGKKGIRHCEAEASDSRTARSLRPRRSASLIGSSQQGT